MTDSDAKKPGLMGRLFGRKAHRENESAIEPPKIANPETGTATLEAEALSSVAAFGGDVSIQAGPDQIIQAEVSEALPIAASTSAQPGIKTGWLKRLTSGLAKTSTRLSDGITGIFTKRKLGADTLEDLEDLLIQADLGLATTRRITDAIAKSRFDKGIAPDDVRRILANEVATVLRPVARKLVIDPAHSPHVILVVGVNGSGKTTTIGKFAAQFRREGRSVLIAAGDTFRAAAIDQLKVWGERTGTRVISREVGADSSGLAYDALREASDVRADVLLVDTAGRLQNKQALMEELEKVIRVMKKIDATAPHEIVLVLDATTGQNALSQVEVFRLRAGVTGLVMTKLDGTARGGILVAIAAKFGLPVYAVGVGEGVDDLATFDPDDFAAAIAGF